LEDIGLENSKSALDRIGKHSLENGFCKKRKTKCASKIPVGTIIQVKPGQMIPLDGKIISGETTVDEATITGEPIPRQTAGDHLFAGTLNKDCFIEMER
jgi:Cd2+/Zn2+-exporting ATPase